MAVNLGYTKSNLAVICIFIDKIIKFELKGMLLSILEKEREK